MPEGTASITDGPPISPFFHCLSKILRVSDTRLYVRLDQTAILLT